MANERRFRALLARAGQGSPLIVTAIYGVGFLIWLLLSTVASRTGMRPIGGLGALVWLTGFALAYAVVTWYRDDDVLAAGFLLGLSAVIGGYVITLIVMGLAQGAIGGAMLAFTGGIIAVVIEGAIAVAVCAFLVWLGRMVHPGIATPVPPPRKH